MNGLLRVLRALYLLSLVIVFLSGAFLLHPRFKSLDAGVDDSWLSAGMVSKVTHARAAWPIIVGITLLSLFGAVYEWSSRRRRVWMFVACLFLLSSLGSMPLYLKATEVFWPKPTPATVQEVGGSPDIRALLLNGNTLYDHAMDRFALAHTSWAVMNVLALSLLVLFGISARSPGKP